jgi:Holliday junction resolvasome RuvABC endonuclease subunit
MILGLDISTSIVGVAIVNPETKELVVSEHIDLTKIDSVFSKAELVGAEIWQINNNHAIKDLFIETALMKFIPGRSKADTIVKLAKFNGIISWMCYDTFGLNPVYLNVNTARSLYGLSFPRGTKGPQRKKMVIESVIEKEKTAFKYEIVGARTIKKGLMIEPTLLS